MPVNKDAFLELQLFLTKHQVQLVAVSKTKPVEDILALYDLGQRDFGENYVQELQAKQPQLPADIRWHFIGHLQSNKVKYIAPYVYMIHGIDSLKLLREVNKQGAKHERVINCLLQVHIAAEETKFGFDETELEDALTLLQKEDLPKVKVRGLMGMASFTGDENVIRREFRFLKSLYDKGRAKCGKDFDTLSMGMSSDYIIATAEGSTMVRIGSMLFGARN